MADSDPSPIQELTTSRARFVAELGERLSALRQGLSRIASAAEPGAELNSVRRRLHALAAAADVLRFASTADALATAEAALASPSGQAPNAPARERVGRILDLLPSLVLGAPIDLARELDAEHAQPLPEPLCIVVLGDPALEALLHKAGPLHAPETHATRDPARALELVVQLSPDLLLVDADHPEAADLLPRLKQASGPRVPLVAVGNFERHEPLLRLIRRGVSLVLPQPLDAGTLQRSVRQACTLRTVEPAEPSHFQRLTSDELVAAIGNEARKAFADASNTERLSGRLDFGSGAEVLAALWAAFARIRGLAVVASQGAVRFSPSGPSGAIPLAPLALGAEHAVSSGPQHTTIAGRRLVVAAADAGVCTLLARTFERLGAVVVTARDGLHALELAEQNWPDAIVADALMPGLDGFELCRRIRLDIALADTPIALVSWKDQLLDRARHVDATLESPAAAIEPSSVASEIEEALGPRAALERRLARHQRISGRLDGITPRSLLQLTSRRAPNTLLTLQSGRSRFEIELAEGKLSSARAFEAGVQRAEAIDALGPFLGLRTGRFALEPLGAVSPAHFAGDLTALIAPLISRARRAREVALSTRLDLVERVVLDPIATAAYLEDSGGTQRSIVTRLLSGISPRALRGPRGWGDSGLAPLDDALLDLSRRGAIVALLDGAGHDLLGAEEASSEPRPPRSERDAALSSSAALLELGEVVRQAVSHTPNPPVTEIAAAGPTEQAPDVIARPELDSEVGHERPSEPMFRAAAPAPLRWTNTDSLPEEPEANPTSNDAAFGDPELGATELADVEDDPEAQADAVWPGSVGSRLRAAAVPLLVTLSAAGLAFVGVRALGEGGWQTLRGALRSSAEAATSDAGATRATHPEQASTAESAPQPRPSPGAAAELAAEQRKVPVDVEFESELTEVPLQARLRPGQGLLEVRSWERQPIYVDGVFMGNYETRLIPLVPGTYQVQLRDGGRHIERSVEVRAGQRTRLSARPKSHRSP